MLLEGTSGESSETMKDSGEVQLPRLSEQIDLEELWFMLGECLSELDKTPDQHAVLILQPAVEAFFLVHAGKIIDINMPVNASRKIKCAVKMAHPIAQFQLNKTFENNLTV